MLILRKRLVKMVAGALSAVMITYALVPTAAFAAHYSAPPHHAGPHHHDHDSKWTRNDTALLIGLAVTIGLTALIINNNKNKTPPSDPAAYAEYREKYVNKLNDDDRNVYDELIKYQPGEYKVAYKDQKKRKLIQKFSKRLPYDFKITSNGLLKEPDGSATKYLFFERL